MFLKLGFVPNIGVNQYLLRNLNFKQFILYTTFQFFMFYLFAQNSNYFLHFNHFYSTYTFIRVIIYHLYPFLVLYSITLEWYFQKGGNLLNNKIGSVILLILDNIKLTEMTSFMLKMSQSQIAHI